MPRWHRRSILATGAALSTGVGLASIGSTAADEHGEDDGSGGGDEPSDVERPTEVAWRYDGPYDIDSTVVVDGRIYTQTGGSVYALDAEGGSQEWETGDIGAERTPAVDDDTVYVAGDPIQAIDAETGEVRWESEISSQTIAVGHGMVYTSSDYTVYALDADDGSIRWERESVTVETDDGERTADELLIGDVSEETVYAFDSSVGADGGVFAGLDPTTGETEVTVQHDESVTEVTAGSGHVAIFPGYDATSLFDMSSQEVVGSTSITLTHAIIDDAYFANGRNGSLSVHDLSDSGAHAWSLDSDHSMPALVGDTVITAYGPDPADRPEEAEDEDRLMAHDLETGEEAWRYTFDDRDWTAAGMSIAADENTVYVSRDGELLALRAEDDEEEDGEEHEEDEDDETEGEDGDEGPDETDGEDEEEYEDDETDETESDCPEDTESDCPDEQDDGDLIDEDGGSGEDDDDGDGDESGAVDDEDDGETGNGDETGNETSDSEDDTDTDDGMPGFTTGAGIVGGALGLEWLRRRGDADEPTE